MADSDLPVTEQRHPDSTHLDCMTPEQMLDLMSREDHIAIDAVDRVSADIATIARRVAATYREGGRIVLLGAGTSGRIAVQEVAELPPTFGTAPDRFLALVASGVSLGKATVSTREDDTDAVQTALHQLGIAAGDIVIGIAASGTTPFVVTGIAAARSLGAWTVGLTSNASTPLLENSEMPVLLATGPEILTGSTRMKAGTAQKIILNRITTIAMVLAGRVTSNHMTELTASVDKLRRRAARIVQDITGIEEARAIDVLERHGWRVHDALTAAFQQTGVKPADLPPQRNQANPV